MMETKTDTMQILVVDDSQHAIDYLKIILERKKFDVVSANDGFDAYKIFKSEDPDIIITDIFMPGKEGLELISEMIEDKPEAKIIAISGYRDNRGTNYLEIAREFGAQKVMEKPIKSDELLGAIEELISER